MLLTACSNTEDNNQDQKHEMTGIIHLFGEVHAERQLLERQLEIWDNFYHNYGMRHLFMERCYATAQFLNMWMQADDDTILYELFDSWYGSAEHSPYVLAFLRNIKENFPETIFHGTDVAHQPHLTAERFLQYLRDNNLQDSPSYQTTLENIAQYHRFSEDFNETRSQRLRSYYKPQNFIREFDALDNQDIMAIHGSYHLTINDEGFEGVPSMATTLLARYGDSLIIYNLADYALQQEPLRFDTITVAGIDFEAAFYGYNFFGYGQNLETWRLIDAYEHEHFANPRITTEIASVEGFPMLIEPGQVYLLITRSDRTIEKRFFLYEEGLEHQGSRIMQRINPCGLFDCRC